MIQTCFLKISTFSKLRWSLFFFTLQIPNYSKSYTILNLQ